MNYPGDRDAAHAQLIEVLPHLFRRLVIALPNEIPGVAKVTPEQFGVLTQVLDRGPLTMSELASARNVALNTATSLVDRLVAAGLVERLGDSSDRRVVRVGITARGRALIEELRTVRRRVIREMLDDLSDDEVGSILAAIPALARLAGLSVTAAAR